MNPSNIQIDRLTGSNNYHTWKFAIQNVLEMQDLEKCILEDTDKKEKDANKLKKAKNILSLSIDQTIFVHIQNCKTPLEIWNTLQRMYEDKGLSRKIGLLRNLISIRLDDCNNMQEYVDKIINTGNKLTGVGFEISEEWIGAILLAGLTEDYRPLILGIEASEKSITKDNIISKLIDNKIDAKENDNAFVSKNINKYSKVKKCFVCGNKTHFAKDCDLKKNKKNNKSNNNKSGDKFMKKMPSQH